MKRVIMVSIMLAFSPVLYAQFGWQSVGGIEILTPLSPPPNSPGALAWPTEIANPAGDGTWNYGKYNFPADNWLRYCRLEVNNSIDSTAAYITQTYTQAAPIAATFHSQQFASFALPQGGATGLWIELETNHGEIQTITWTASEGWTTAWVQINQSGNIFTTDYNSLTIRLGITKDPGTTTGTRSMLIDRCFIWDWVNQATEWSNWDFETSFDPFENRCLITTPLPLPMLTEENPVPTMYDIYLNATEDSYPPVADVLVTVDPDDQLQINGNPVGSPVVLTFTTAEPNLPQTVTVTAYDDDLDEGPHTGTITHTSASSDPCYNNLIIRMVTYDIQDNDDARSCYDPCDVPEPTNLIDLHDLANLSTNWLQPYTGQLARRPLEFRALLVNPNPDYKRWDPPHTDTAEWTNRLNMWRDEGFNALVHWIVCELFFHGTHKLIQIEDYPEARHLTSTQVQNNIDNFSWVLSQAKQRSMDNYLFTHHILYTPNFASAHGLPTNGERSELTRAYTESVYAEFCRTYPDLDGFYGSMGEPVPGRRSEWFAEAVVPGLTCTGGRENTASRPRFIVNQWQTPLEDYLEDIAPADVYPDTWLSLHAYNGEQVTDAEPWPFVVTWAKRTGLPTVVMLYPANIFNFPFNSPEFAYEIANEIKLIPNIKGFVYMEWSGRSLSPLFRKALAYYASTNEEYSDEPWLDILEAEYGNRTAAEHFLNAFKLSGRILPDKDALFFCPHDNLKRELNIPYSYWQLNQNRPWNWQTSRVRGKVLVPVWHYASMIAENANRFEGKDGTEAANQYPVFRTDGGSAYDIIPPDHMASIRQRGADAYEAATLGLAAATSNQTKAEHMQRYMKGYKLLSQYFETKVAATVEAFIAAKNGSATRKTNAQTLANQAYNEWVAFYNFCMIENPKLNDLAQYYNDEDLREIGIGQETMADLLNEELSDKNNIGTIFGW